MKVATVFDAVGMILTIALVTAVLIRGSAAAQVIRAIGDAFNAAVGTAING